MSTTIEWLCLAGGLCSLLLFIGSLMRERGRSRARAVWAVVVIGLLRISWLSTTEVTERQQWWQAGCAGVLLVLAVHAWHTDRTERRRDGVIRSAGE